MGDYDDIFQILFYAENNVGVLLLVFNIEPLRKPALNVASWDLHYNICGLRVDGLSRITIDFLVHSFDMRLEICVEICASVLGRYKAVPKEGILIALPRQLFPPKGIEMGINSVSEEVPCPFEKRVLVCIIQLLDFLVLHDAEIVNLVHLIIALATATTTVAVVFCHGSRLLRS